MGFKLTTLVVIGTYFLLKATTSNPKCKDQQYNLWRGMLDTTLCDTVCQWFSPSTLTSSINKTNRHDKTEILLKWRKTPLTKPINLKKKKSI
jgi:hypothetical protein